MKLEDGTERPMGELLGLDVHYIEPSTAEAASGVSTFEPGETACGLEANRPPRDAIEGYSAKHDLALTTSWDLVTCDACKKKNGATS